MMEETNMADIIIVEEKYEIQRSVAPYDIREQCAEMMPLC